MMNPEQIQTAVESAISQGNLFPWWSYILFVVLSGIASYLAIYLREKGKNLATKEDIGEITDRVEKVKLDYSKESHRFQVAYSGLLKKRAEVIEELYHLIVETEEMFGRFVNFAEWENDPSKDKLRKEGGQLLYDFLREYKKNRIYFSEDVCDKLQSFSDSIYEVIMPYSIAFTAQIEGERLKDFTNQWVKANKDFKEQIPKARKIIEEEFRLLLCVK
ncbi:MAG: hypothetical protein A2173_04615 [Planctomycetes bacterium RBG_13_44_8b]|nr:MAG: hypothetical protein A2173_04615 [Planctomycetes bacterium RBG_13_44_8b]